MILVLLLYSLFGLTFTLGKISLYHARPFIFISARMLIAGAGLLAYMYFKHIKCAPQKKDWPYYLQIGLIGIFIPYGLRAWGLQYMSSTKAAFIFTLMPFFTALFAYLAHKEKLSILKTIGLMIGFIGMIPTLFTSSSQEDLFRSIGFLSLPELAILGAVASFAYNLIALQNLVKHRGCPAMLANAMSMLIGGFMSFNLSLLVEPKWIIGDTKVVLIVLAAQILISNLICANLQASLLKHYSPTFMAFAGFLTPLSAALFGWILLGEKLSLLYLLSFFIVLLGLIIYYLDDLIKHKKLPKFMLFDSKEF